MNKCIHESTRLEVKKINVPTGGKFLDFELKEIPTGNLICNDCGKVINMFNK